MNDTFSDTGKEKPRIAAQPRPYVRVPIALRIIGGLLLLIAIGTLLLMLPGVGAQGPLTFDQALFTAVSALCVNGLTIITPSTQLTLFGQLILLIEIQVGGVGFMVVVIAALRLLRRQIFLVDRLAIRDSLGLPEREQFGPILRRVLLTVVIIETVGAFLLWLNWRNQFDDVSALWYAIFHSISAFCNAGFDLFSGQPQFPTGIPRDPFSLIVLGAIIVLGGLGFPILAELVHWHRQKRLSLHTRLTLWLSLALVVIGAVGFLIGEVGARGLPPTTSWPQAVLYSTFQSISTRSAGFTLGDLSTFQPATQFLTICLMFIGTAPASMGGGITTGTVLVLLLSMWGYARGFAKPQWAGRSLPAELPRRSAAVLTVSLFVVIIATWLLLVTGNGKMDEMLFEVVSAFATTGLTLPVTSKLNGIGQVIIMLMMIWGRLGAMTIILALARRQPPEPIQYPEESILIG
ncbi:MAG: potassium transporter [Chloroflexota bacterium]|nr:MAG: potassium transporter [Chloroflexota bacterium]